MRVTYPWPGSALSLNGSHGHWSKRQRAAKPLREQSYWLTKAAQDRAFPGDDEIMVSVTFHPPSRRRFDLDGLLTRSKPILDGFADAIEVNDYRFALTLRRAEPKEGGAVVIEV